MPKNLAQKGIAHILLLIAAVGVIGFILVSQSAQFKNNLFAKLFPKSVSRAEQIGTSWVNVTGNLANLSSECGNLTILSSVPGANTAIAGVALRGLWASNDGNGTWANLGTGSGSATITNRPSWVSYDPLNSAIFWESGIYNGGGVYRTTNGGQTFQQLGSVSHNDFVSVDFTDPNRQTLLAGGHEQTRTVWKSTNGGQTWTNVGINLPAGTGFSSDPLVINSQTYVVNSDPGFSGGTPGIYRTTDGGTTWVQVTTRGPSGPPLVTANGTIYWPNGNGLVRSTDQGVSWTQVGSNLLTIHPIELSDGRLVSVGTNNTLMISSNSGSSWSSIGPAAPFAPASLIYSASLRGFFISHWDCGSRVLANAIARLDFDLGTTTPTPTPTPTSTSTPAPAIGIGSRVPWQGGNWYLQGANVPWYNFGSDFGRGTGGGVSGNRATLSVGFQRMRDANLHVARWWVFPGDPWQITRDAAGAPTGINPAVYADFDAALALADTYDLYYNFVLFSSAVAPPRAWFTDATQRTQLASVLGQLFAHYRGNPRVLSWEIVNEPEWDIPPFNRGQGQIDMASVQATVREITSSIHANSNAYATVGAFEIAGLPNWLGLGLDYYSPHWYDGMSGPNDCARCTTYDALRTRYGLDKPVVIGELSAGSDALNKFNDFYNRGYAGAWPWSLFSDRTSDHLTIDMAASTTFTSTHIDVGPRVGTVPSVTPAPTSTPAPVSTPTPIPTPLATPSPTPIPTPIPTPRPTTTPAPIGSLLPGVPTVTPLVSCLSGSTTGDAVRISWVNPTGGNPVSWVDLSSSSTFSSFYNKTVSGTSTNAASGFALYPQRTTLLTLNPNTAYFVRLYNNDPNNGHSPTTSFLLPNCPTPTPAPTPTSTPAPVGTSQTITFNDLAIYTFLSQYPRGVINWGNNWFVARSVNQFTTNNLHFSSSTGSSRSFSFLTPRILVRLDMMNHASVPSNVTISCSGNPNLVVAVPAAGVLTNVNTNWSNPCTTVTITSSAGWVVHYDNLVIQ